jgi:hypothetical protein
LTFQVHQGVDGCSATSVSDTNSCCKRAYFQTFANEENKTSLLNSKKTTEQNAIIIYVKRGRNQVIKTDARNASFERAPAKPATKLTCSAAIFKIY